MEGRPSSRQITYDKFEKLRLNIPRCQLATKILISVMYVT